MKCWECKASADHGTLCDDCRAVAAAEGRRHARVKRTTEAERLLMRCLRAQGLSHKHIARCLSRSPQTVHRHAP